MSYTPSTAFQSAVTPNSVTSYVPTKQFDPRLSIYNVQTDTLRKIRAALAKASAGTGYARIACIGDSTTEGAGAAKGVSDWPTLLRNQLAGKGYTSAGTGLVTATSLIPDPRVTTTGAPTVVGLLLQLAGASGTQSITFTSDVAGTSVDVYYLNQTAGQTMTVAIDGAAAVQTTFSGDGTVAKYTVTGLANTTHTVVVARGTGTVPFIAAFEVRGASGVSISNLGANGKASNYFTAPGSGAQIYDHVGVAVTAWGCKLMFIMLQINDANASVAIATYKANIQATINYALAGGSDVILVMGDPNATAGISAYNDATYALADTNNLSVLDIWDRWKSLTISNGLGLMFDGVHPNPSGNADIARAALNCLGA